MHRPQFLHWPDDVSPARARDELPPTLHFRWVEEYAPDLGVYFCAGETDFARSTADALIDARIRSRHKAGFPRLALHVEAPDGSGVWVQVATVGDLGQRPDPARDDTQLAEHAIAIFGDALCRVAHAMNIHALARGAALDVDPLLYDRP